jgi:hypothetical protein
MRLFPRPIRRLRACCRLPAGIHGELKNAVEQST